MATFFNDLKEGQKLYITTIKDNAIQWFIETIIAITFSEKFGTNHVNIQTENGFFFTDIPMMFSTYFENNHNIYTDKEEFIKDIESNLTENLNSLLSEMEKIHNKVLSCEKQIEEISKI